MLIFSVALAGGAPELRERPAELERSAACTLWRGTASGNDPSTKLELEICGDTDIIGRLQWSSTISGHNLRTIQGAWSRDGLTFHDTALVRSEPSEGWYFCLIEDYRLVRIGSDTLSGTYHSRSCNDRAELTLTLVEGNFPPLKALPPAPAPKTWACATLPVVGVLPLLSVLAIRRRRQAPGCKR